MSQSREEILKQGCEIFKRCGKELSRDVFITLDGARPSMRKIRKAFGSWATFKAECLSELGFENLEFTEEHNENSCCLTSKSKRITTLEALLEYAKVDLDLWEVDRYVVNKWEVGAKQADGSIDVSPLVQVKAWLKKKTAKETEILKRELNGLIEEIKVYSPMPLARHYKKPTDTNSYMYEIAIMDLHLANLAWEQEVGKDYDMSIAEDRYFTVLEDLIHRVEHSFDLEKILLPTGNDFFHVDNLENMTTAGTKQDVDSRWQKAFQKARHLLIEGIEVLSELAPVEVPIIPGNHDWERMFYLGEVLDAWFYNNKFVTIDNSPKPRKYCKFGKNLIGFTHGKEEKLADLPLIMATECSGDWSDTEFREWHIGHFHKPKETVFNAGDTFNGISVKIIPSLCSADAWHTKKGFVQNRSASEAFLWDSEKGCVGQYRSFVD